MKAANFNLHCFSNEKYIRNFRFRIEEVPIIARIFVYLGKTPRRRYRCSYLEVIYIVFQRLCFPCRWYDLKPFFDRSSQFTSEVFWHAFEVFQPRVSKQSETFRIDLIQSRKNECKLRIGKWSTYFLFNWIYGLHRTILKVDLMKKMLYKKLFIVVKRERTG